MTAHTDTLARTTSHWRPFADMSAPTPPLVIASGDGAWVTDTTGTRYLDATAALWFCQIGYGRREVADAIHAQALRMHAHHTFGDYSNGPAIELAERLSALAPGGDWKVFYTSGGSDSVDTAVKYVRRYWRVAGELGRTIVLSRGDSYHGMHVGGTQIGGIDGMRLGYGELLADTDRVDRDDPAALEAAILRHGPDRVAAFLCEPIIGAGGVHFPTPGYLTAVREICRRHGVLFIADEVVTAFGRTGHWFASERFGIDPDLILCAKGINSGYVPLGAVLVNDRVAAPFWSGETGAMFKHGYTYSGHATATAAALANLDYLADHDLLTAAHRIEGALPTLLGALTDLPVVESVRTGAGALAAVQLDRERLAADPTLAGRAVHAVREAGALTRAMSCGALQISPTLTITADELGHLADTLARGLRTLG
ncbi:aminotransferase family protein [Rhodococcus koreensis]|uniref:aminotransferase family protein n=1 Tax=Rhodococcus koreensis TaxID=99653 RepID=UPI0036DD7B14